jgi:hypothetical protein
LPVKNVPGSPRTIKITFPLLPYVELRPNYQRSNFWYKRAEVRKIAREEAYFAGGKVLCPKQIELCEIEEVFTVPAKRHIDVENMMAACKSWVDGLCDAGIIIDDDWQHVKRLSGRVVYQKGVQQTEIIITEVE